MDHIKMKKILLLLFIALWLFLAIPTTAMADDGIYINHPHDCEGCRRVHQIKQMEYDDMLFGSYSRAWSLPSWWILYGYGGE